MTLVSYVESPHPLPLCRGGFRHMFQSVPRVLTRRACAQINGFWWHSSASRLTAAGCLLNFRPSLRCRQCFRSLLRLPLRQSNFAFKLSLIADMRAAPADRGAVSLRKD